MASDYQKKKRSVHYFNDLLLNDPVRLLRDYSLTVHDDVADHRGVIESNPVRHGLNYDWTKVKGNRIAYATLTKLPRRAGAQLNYAPGADDAVFVSGKFAADPNAVPVYFLPWIKSGSGGAARLHIPDVATKAQVADANGNMIPNPGIFFTASITGCSIFFQGNDRTPTVFHAGGATGHNTDPQRAANHWRLLVNANKDATKGALTGEVNKTQYIAEPGVSGGTTTNRADQYQTWLNNKYTNKLQVSMVQPWGCVMGFRDAGTGRWTFYLQENATIFYYEYVKNFFGRRTGNVSATMKGVARPLTVTTIFPGAGHAWIPNQQPKLKFA